MKFLKKNKVIIFIVIFLAITAFGLYEAYKFFKSDNGVVYGNRLDGIEEVAITDDQETKLIAGLKTNASVSNVIVNTLGKTVNIIITVADDTALDAAKTIGSSTLGYFEKDQLSFYDLQVFIKKNDTAQNNFPIIGYKHYQSDSYIWTKDREVTQ